MQSRIDQMLNAWNQLELMKSVRTSREKKSLSARLDAVPVSSFEKMPVLFNGEIQSGNEAASAPRSSATSLSTPPKLTSDRFKKYFLHPSTCRSCRIIFSQTLQPNYEHLLLLRHLERGVKAMKSASRQQENFERN